MYDDSPLRWWACEGEELAHKLRDISRQLREDQQGRVERARQSMSLYEGRRLDGLYAGAYSTWHSYGGDGYDRLRWKLCRSIVDTVTNKIAGTNKPKAQFVTSGADWATKRRALKLDQFVEGQFSQPMPGYDDVWALMARVFRDAAVVGDGFVFVSSDLDTGRIVYERVPSCQVFVDPCESEDGSPLNLFRVRGYDEDQLISLYPEHADKIRAAETFEPERHRATRRTSRSVAVYEGWRLPLSVDKPGKHAIVVEGQVLESEDWERNEFPCVHLQWTPHMLGYWACSLVEEVEEVCEEVNCTLQRMSDAERLTSKGVCLYEDGAASDDDLVSNEDAINIKYRKGFAPPQWVNPNAFGPATVQYLELNKAQAFEGPGISQMGATARKEPGVTAAVAMRTIDHQQTERLSLAEEQYESSIVTLARLTVYEAEAIADEHPDFSAKWKGDGFVKEIKLADASLEDDQYVVQIHPVSGNKNTPADRLQLAEELNSTGKLSDDAYLQVLLHHDPKGEVEKKNKQSELIGRFVEQWLEATPEAEKSGEFRWDPPDRFFPLPEAALLDVVYEYYAAKLNGAPAYNLEFFLLFIEQLDKILLKKAQEQASLQAQASGAAPAPSPAQPGAMN